MSKAVPRMGKLDGIRQFDSPVLEQGVAQPAHIDKLLSISRPKRAWSRSPLYHMAIRERRKQSE